LLYRLIAPDWLHDENPNAPRVMTGEFNEAAIAELNAKGYNIYHLPNYPSNHTPGVTIDGTHIDTFNYVYVDMDLKSADYADKDSFISALAAFPLPPTKIVDSGNGVHAYWAVIDLDAMSYLHLQRRLCRYFKTDEAVSKIFQLMRVSNTINTKVKDSPKPCKELYADYDTLYTAEQLDAKLPPISKVDEVYCQTHFDKTYGIVNKSRTVDDQLPLKFCQLIKDNAEVKEIWSGASTDDRSKSDYRLGHIMFASGFNKEEAASVLVNTAKALARAPVHRIGYAQAIIDKIWTYELLGKSEGLSRSVKEILNRGENALKGTRFACWPYIDATLHGFRLGQIIGLVAGSGVGKTAMALNMFMGFVQTNPDYDHFFIPLEQPVNEIADRWRTMCGDNEHLYDKVHVISNYADDGSFRHLSFDDIKQYLLEFQKTTGKKIGCVVIDHIGALKKKGKDGENQDLMTICHEMKAFTIATNTLLVMQSQSSREKAGIGDLELNKDAAYGTVYFESYCDYLVTMWQPLKRCYNQEGCPTVTSFKFCKIRHKKMGKDLIKEDTCYNLFFDPSNESMRELTQEEEVSFDFWAKQALNKRKKDRKTDLVAYQSTNWGKDGAANNSADASGTERTSGVSEAV
jgi:KaiC protein